MENLSMWMARNLRPHYEYTIKDFDPIAGNCNFNMTLVPFRMDMEMPKTGDWNFSYMTNHTIHYDDLVLVTRRAITELMKEGKINGIQMSDLAGKRLDAVSNLTNRCTDGTYEETTEIVNRVLEILMSEGPTMANPSYKKSDDPNDAVAFIKNRLDLKWGVVVKPTGYTIIISPFGSFTNRDMEKKYTFDGKEYDFYDLGAITLAMIYDYMLHDVPNIAGEYGMAMMVMREVESYLPALTAAQARLNEEAAKITDVLRNKPDIEEQIVKAIRNPGNLDELDKELSAVIEKYVTDNYMVTLDCYVGENYRPEWQYISGIVGLNTVPLGFQMFNKTKDVIAATMVLGRNGVYTAAEVEQKAATAFFETVSRFPGIMEEYNKIFREFKYAPVTNDTISAMINELNRITDNLNPAIRNTVIKGIEHADSNSFTNAAAKFFVGFTNA